LSRWSFVVIVRPLTIQMLAYLEQVLGRDDVAGTGECGFRCIAGRQDEAFASTIGGECNWKYSTNRPQRTIQRKLTEELVVLQRVDADLL